MKRDALAAGLPDDGKPLAAGGTGATAYADAVAVLLGICGRQEPLTTGARSVPWHQPKDEIARRSSFARQAIPMVWDYAEANPLQRLERQP